MKHLLYETRQSNFGFIPEQQLSNIKNNDELYYDLLVGLKSVIFARVEDVDDQLFLELMNSEEKVKEIIEQGLPLKQEIVDYNPMGLDEEE